jgi:hypothetical protein
MMPVVEGETSVMAAQNTRFLFNKVKDLKKGKTVDGLFTYLA